MAVTYQRYVTGTSVSSSLYCDFNTQTAGCSVGELAFALISRTAVVAPTGVPTGWTLLDSHMSTYGIWLYYKILEAGDITTQLRWTWAAATKTQGGMGVYTGHDATTPIESYTKGTYGTASAQTLNLGSVTTSEANIIVFASCYSTASKTYDLSSQTLTERLDMGSTSPDQWQYIGDKNAAWGGGTFTPSTATNYISGAATYRGGFMVAVNAGAVTWTPGDPLGMTGFYGT